MDAKGYLWVGSFIGVSVWLIDITANPLTVSFAAFCGGVLFGKGYCLWETQSRLARQKEGGEDG